MSIIHRSRVMDGSGKPWGKPHEERYTLYLAFWPHRAAHCGTSCPQMWKDLWITDKTAGRRHPASSTWLSGTGMDTAVNWRLTIRLGYRACGQSCG